MLDAIFTDSIFLSSSSKKSMELKGTPVLLWILWKCSVLCDQLENISWAIQRRYIKKMCKDFTRAITYQSLLVSFYNALQQFGTVQVPKRSMKRRGKEKKKNAKSSAINCHLESFSVLQLALMSKRYQISDNNW